MRFGRTFIDNLRTRVNISSVIGTVVNLKHKGKGEFVGLCPFHKEKTPSFSVSDNKGFYHCFGCGVHGDVIRFITDYKGLPYAEAIKDLARQAGIELPKLEKTDLQREKRLEDSYEVLELATKWFENNLNSSAGMEARIYLKNRGLTEDTIKKYRLGFAPDEWEALKKYLNSKNVDDETIAICGLITSNENNTKKYDRFRNRIIFPIFSSTGKVIAFGGRIMGNSKELAKYINSPETDLFKKGYTLYGFNFAKDMAYKTSQIIAVEGYMDVIALQQAGFENTVAPLGTALTENHIKLLWKVSQEPILCLDGDEAGLRASKKFAEEYVALLEPGYTIKFAFVPNGLDPDEFIKANGKQAFERILKNSKVLSDMLWDASYSSSKLKTPEDKSAFAQKINNFVASIKNANVREFYKKEYSSRIFKLGLGNKNNNVKITPNIIVNDQVRSVITKNISRLESYKQRLILLACYNPAIILTGEVEEILASIELENKLVEKLAENAINFCAQDNDSKADYNGFIKFLENSNQETLINFLKNNALKDEFLWQENGIDVVEKAIFGWRYLLAEYYLCLAEDKKIKLLEQKDDDISFLFEKQKEQQTEILNLSRKRDEKREEFEEKISNN
jgi:DNA primase